MFGGKAPGANNHYLYVGVSALENINDALKAAEITNVTSILDMPSGHGRVTRALRVAFPTAELSVSDLDVDAVEFCTKQFDSKPLVSSADFSRLNYEKLFDLIWVGSLITHFPATVTSDFIDFVLRHIAPKGVAVISSHGAKVIERIGQGVTYGLESEARQNVVSEYSRSGYGYADYATTISSNERYGISIVTRDWLISAITRAGGKILLYQEGAWGRHHDVVSFVHGN